MKQKSYFKQVFRRTNFKLSFLSFFYSICSVPRLLLEVFIRKNMGSRYFSFGLSIILFLLFLITLLFSAFSQAASFSALGSNGYGLGIFGILFFVFANKRRSEINSDPTHVSFDEFSLSTGELTGWFKSRKENGTSLRRIEIWFEPLPFFIGGLVLMFIPFTRILGLLLLLSSVLYSLSYMGAYALARDFIMDKIDEKIAGEEMGQALKSGLAGHEARGFTNRSPIPTDEEHRDQLYNLILKRDKSGEPTAVAQ
ncbi:hypothetical protein [Gracilimonas sp.]|uniref:hypothetical protein n=1 Tax=Gracilimonas sp. TaxID=1974203 RepID=UPI0032EBC82B